MYLQLLLLTAAASSQQQQQGNLVRKLRLAHIQLPLDKQQQLDELEQQIKGETGGVFPNDLNLFLAC